MAKIAIDVVLLPSKEMMDRVIEVNKKLLRTFDNKIVLNKESCLPHISLAMGGIEEKDLITIEKILQKVAEEFSVMELKVIDVYAETIPTGKKVSGFEIEKINKLQSLHEIIMKKLTPYFTYDITLDMLYFPSQVEEVTLSWVKNYSKNSSFEKYFPHITIGFGEIDKDKVSLPINFTASKLALCHLGNYCTCRKILLSTELIKKNLKC